MMLLDLLKIDLYQILSVRSDSGCLTRIFESLKAEEERLEHVKEDRIMNMNENKENMRKFINSKK
jgi:hypothetical protein